MKLHKSLLLFIFLATGCSNASIDTENPEATADYIQQTFFPNDGVEIVQVDLENGIEDVYNFGDTGLMWLTKENNVEQIQFRDLEKEEVTNILEEVEFPITEEVSNFLNSDYDQHILNNYATTYKNIGISILGSDVESDNLRYTLTIYYDEESFNEYVDTWIHN